MESQAKHQLETRAPKWRAQLSLMGASLLIWFLAGPHYGPKTFLQRIQYSAVDPEKIDPWLLHAIEQDQKEAAEFPIRRGRVLKVEASRFKLKNEGWLQLAGVRPAAGPSKWLAYVHSRVLHRPVFYRKLTSRSVLIVQGNSSLNELLVGFGWFVPDEMTPLKSLNQSLKLFHQKAYESGRGIYKR